MMPCPSRKTVALTSKVSPGTAFAGRLPQSTAGSTSRIGIRPITLITLPTAGQSTPPRGPVFGKPRGHGFLRAGTDPVTTVRSEKFKIIFAERTGVLASAMRERFCVVSADRIWSARESDSPVHRPRHPARAAGRAAGLDAEPPLVLACADRRSVRLDRPRCVAGGGRRSDRDAQRGGAAADGGDGP